MSSPSRLQVLYLCTGNSCRSQMAEALTRDLRGNLIEAHSAGVDPKGLDPWTVRTMRELGIDISHQRSKSVEDVEGMEFDYVVTLCDQAQESCPFFPAKTRVLHVPFEDPPAVAATARHEEGPWMSTGGCATRSGPLSSTCQKPCRTKKQRRHPHERGSG